MFKKTLGVLLCGAVLATSLVGCSSKSLFIDGAPKLLDPKENPIATIDGKAIESDVYQYNLYSYLNSQLSQIAQYGVSPEEYESSYKQALEMTAEGDKTNADYIAETLSKQIKSSYIVNQIFEKEKLTIPQKNLDEMNKSNETLVKSYGTEELLKKYLAIYGADMETLKKAQMDGLRTTTLFDYWYGKDGKKEKLTTATVENYYNSMYKTADHILVKAVDASNEALPKAEKDVKKAKATEILNKLNAGGDWAALKKENNEDEGSNTAGFKGYDIVKSGDQYADPASSNGYDAAFGKGAFELKMGEYKIVESSFGYHIMKLLPTSKTYYNEDQIRIEMRQDEFQKQLDTEIEKLKVEWNEDTLAKLDPLKVQISSPKYIQEVITEIQNKLTADASNEASKESTKEETKTPTKENTKESSKEQSKETTSK